ncbi:hypothetical protein AAY53_17090 [Vibrio metoecus]|nr:hypothetical protein AAY53_17090 [Vibrio metoecus]
MEILSIFSTLFAVWFGYWLANRKQESQINNTKDSLYSELKLIEEEFVNWYKTTLLIEYETPQRRDFSYAVEIDWDYLNSLQQSLGSNVLATT